MKFHTSYILIKFVYIVTNLFGTPAAIISFNIKKSKCLSFEECAPTYWYLTLAFYNRYSFVIPLQLWTKTGSKTNNIFHPHM